MYLTGSAPLMMLATVKAFLSPQLPNVHRFHSLSIPLFVPYHPLSFSKTISIFRSLSSAIPLLSYPLLVFFNMITATAINALLLSLPLAALAGMPHEGSLRRKHLDIAARSSYARRDAVYKLEDLYQGSTFLEYVVIGTTISHVAGV